jgi:hypothetical protein
MELADPQVRVDPELAKVSPIPNDVWPGGRRRHRQTCVPVAAPLHAIPFPLVHGVGGSDAPAFMSIYPGPPSARRIHVVGR